MNEAKRKYKKKVEELRVELYPTDEDIKNRLKERLDAGEPKATYIKRLIRDDILLRKTDGLCAKITIIDELHETPHEPFVFSKKPNTKVAIKKDGE